MTTVTIELPDEGVTVTPTCDCGEPLHTTGGWVSWACWNEACPISLIPMWEDATFVDEDGTEWVPLDEGGWVDVVK